MGRGNLMEDKTEQYFFELSKIISDFLISILKDNEMLKNLKENPTFMKSLVLLGLSILIMEASLKGKELDEISLDWLKGESKQILQDRRSLIENTVFEILFRSMEV